MDQWRCRNLVETKATGSVSDADLVVIALRDPERFVDLYHRYADRLYRYVLGKTGDPDTADDVISETMIDVLEQLDRFDPERGSFVGWLFTIASRRAADHHRIHRRFWRSVRRGWKFEPVAETPAERLVQQEEEVIVRAAMDRLSEDDREILLLRYSAGLTSAEIGGRLAITPDNARVRLQRARRRLAQELEGLEDVS